jgi:hypothetical protein
MQSDNEPKQSSDAGDTQGGSGDDVPRPQWLPRGLFDAIGPIALLVLVVGSIAAYYAYHYVTKDSVRFQFWVGFMFSFMALVVVTIQVVIYAQQAEFMKRQAKTMEDQSEISDRLATTALRQFEITDRPWLAVDVSIIGPLTFNEQGGNITFRIVAENVGRSIALNATVHAKMIIPDFDGDLFREVLAEQLRVCKEAHSRFMAYAVFPGRKSVSDWSFGLGPAELERGCIATSNFFHLYIVGCVDYQFSGHDTHHQTRFIYGVNRTDKSGRPLALSMENDIPLEHLFLQKFILGESDYAD